MMRLGVSFKCYSTRQDKKIINPLRYVAAEMPPQTWSTPFEARERHTQTHTWKGAGGFSIISRLHPGVPHGCTESVVRVTCHSHMVPANVIALQALQAQ